jgi:HEPN domain-containing protein
MRPRYPDARPDVETEYDRDTAQEALSNAQTGLAFVGKSMSDARESPDAPTTSELG